MNKYCLLILLSTSISSFAFWSPVPGKFKTIKGAKDGTVMALDHSGSVWMRDNKNWELIPGKLTTLSLGSNKHIIGIDKKNQMWKLNTKKLKWNKIKSSAKAVSVSEDGTVYIINENKDLLVLKNNKWIPENIKLSNIVAIDKNKAWGITPNGEVVQKIDGIWEDLPGKLIQMDAYSDKFALGIKSNNTLWLWRGEQWKRGPGKINKVAFSGNGNVWALNKEGKLYHAKIPEIEKNCNKTTTDGWFVKNCKKKRKGKFRLTNLMANTHLSVLDDSAVLLGYRGWSPKWKINQAWRFSKKDGGLFKIKNASGKCLDALNIKGEVTLKSCTKKDGQLWRISDNKNDGISLESFKNQLCLAAVAPDQPVRLIDCDNEKRQLWKLNSI